MATRSAYSTGETRSVLFGSCDVSGLEAPPSQQGGLRIDWGRASALALCLVFWAAVATLASAALI